MKNILIAMAGIILFSTCKKVEKDVRNYFPKVKTVSAVVQPDGTVKLTGQLTSTGAGEMNGVGFCMDTLPNPKMHYGQKICDTLFDDSFYGTYAYLDATKPYYFRTWAVNEWGYVYGEDILVNDIKVSPSVMSCIVDSNTVDIAQYGLSAVSYVSAMEVSGSDWESMVQAGSHILRFTFHDKPVTGIWKISDITSGRGRYVNLLYQGPATFTSYAKNGKVYINQLNKDVFEVYLCDVQLPAMTAERNLKAHFKVYY
jgi:hypothetical protein